MREGSGAAAGVHWSFWATGAIALLFNLAGIVNFISQMSATAVAAMPDLYRTIIESRPVWATWAFAVAVFGGGLGCLLLLFRKSFAHFVFIAALLGATVAQVPFLGMTSFPPEALIGGAVQLLVTAFLIWYAKLAERKGWIG